MRWDFRPGRFVKQIQTYSRGLYYGRTIDSTPSVFNGEDVHYAIQIDVSDSTSDDNASIGLYNDAALGGSAFRWVTDRPEYDSAVTPTGELPTVNATKWAEGLITDQASLGSPIRLININVAGNYGSLSGFNFKIDNTGLLFDIIDDNSYNIINRKIRFYIILGDVFFNVWSGIVARKSHGELTLDIICEDDFKNIHKVIPPQTANETLFPKILKKSIGKTIPVTLGQVNHARLLNIQKKSDPIVLVLQTDGFGSDFIESSIAIVRAVGQNTDFDDNLTDITISIMIGSKSFSNGELVGKFLRVVMEGGSDDFYKITGNSSSQFLSLLGQNLVTIIINASFDTTALVLWDPTIDNFTQTHKYSWVEIFDFESTYIVSNDEIDDFPDAQTGQSADLTYFDKDQEDFINVAEAVETEDKENINGTGFPGLIAFTNASNNNGNFKKSFTIQPKTVKIAQVLTSSDRNIIFNDFGVQGSDLPNLIDKSLGTKNTVTFERPIGTGTLGSNTISLRLKLPDDFKAQNYDQFFVVIDYDITSNRASSADFPRGKMGIFPVSINNVFGGFKIFAQFLNGQFVASTPEEIRLINPAYYTLPDLPSPGLEALSKVIDLSGFYLSPQEFKAYPFIDLGLNGENNFITSSQNEETTFDVYQVAFSGVKSIPVTNDNIYVKAIGEKFDGNPTDNVLEIFRSILRTYDGLAAADVNTLFMTSRVNWMGGRQLLERRSSFTYLKQLAMQSFVGLYPSRLGIRTLKPYRDFIKFTSGHAFAYDNGNIIKGSINNFRLGPINEVYNEFNIRYEQNNANGRFDKSLFLKRVDKSAFPGKFISTGPGLTTPIADVSDTNLSEWGVQISPDGSAVGTVFWIGGDPLGFAIGDFISIDDSAGSGTIEFGTVFQINLTNTLITFSFNNSAGFTNGQNSFTGTVWKQGTGVPKWSTFAGGFSSYSKGSQMWTVCRNSYLKSMVVRELPDEYALCKWYIDEDSFNGDPGDQSTPMKYLELLVEWTTRQKELVEFTIPLTLANMSLELLDPASFKDQKFTADELRTGYITKIKHNPATDTIILELTLIPADIESVTDCQIVESGLHTDTIVESGTEADTIVEPGC